jgi:hypothetical protein
MCGYVHVDGLVRSAGGRGPPVRRLATRNERRRPGEHIEVWFDGDADEDAAS